MAHGRAVVASGVGGLVGISGILVPPGDVERLREVVEQLLADAGWREQLGAEARRVAEDSFSPEASAAALATVYAAATGGRSG
jgi:glycosyltransferase involved in cell wall biosynthesis